MGKLTDVMCWWEEWILLCLPITAFRREELDKGEGVTERGKKGS